MNRFEKLSLATALSGLALNANAAITTTGITDAMTDAGLAIAVVGAAYLVVKVGIKVWPWVAAALGR